jgi:putative DNA primase/helicase
MADDWLNETPGDWRPDGGSPSGSVSEGESIDPERSRAVARTVADIQPRTVKWLWHHRVPFGMPSELVGDPGEGKSHLTLALATAVTLGGALPGDPKRTVREPSHVLLVCMEDSPEATVRPRLEGMGADLTRVTILDGIDGDAGEPVPLDLSRVDHRMELRYLVEALGVSLLIIDPITAHLGGANEWKDSEVRSILAPLSRLADDTGAAILLVRHLRKSDSGRAIYRAGGSIAFTASVRSSLLVGRPEGEEIERAVVRVKGNLSSEPPAVGFVLDEAGFRWTQETDLTPSDLLQGDTSSAERSKADEARDWLLAQLEDGPVPVQDLKRQAGMDEIGWRTLERVKKKLGVEARREGGIGKQGKWSWCPPTKTATPTKSATEDPAGGLSETARLTKAPDGSAHLTRRTPYIKGSWRT